MTFIIVEEEREIRREEREIRRELDHEAAYAHYQQHIIDEEHRRWLDLRRREWEDRYYGRPIPPPPPDWYASYHGYRMFKPK